MSSVRVDSWLWAVRLTKTRSVAAAACRAGHVKVNGVAAKPAQHVAVGDEVRLRLAGRERIVEVTAILAKRVGPSIAATSMIDRSPPPPSREVMATVPMRDRGAGRPTKRDRRALDRLRSSQSVVVLCAVAALLLAGCSSDTEPGPATPTTKTEKPGTGPAFALCGGISEGDVMRITGLKGLRLTTQNSTVCEWSTGGARADGHASFNWYRGSPIARERANLEADRDVVKDYELGGGKGFLGYSYGSAQSWAICEVGLAFAGDFIEWSVAYRTNDTEKICADSIELTRISLDRAKK